LEATILALLKLAAGIILITKGADWFTEAAVRIAEATHVPRVIIGATIVSLATTMPEFTVSTYSALTARADFAVGNAIGSTVCNIGLILGTCLMIRPMLIDRPSLTFQQGLIMVGAGGAVALLGITGSFQGWIQYRLSWALQDTYIIQCAPPETKGTKRCWSWLIWPTAMWRSRESTFEGRSSSSCWERDV